MTPRRLATVCFRVLATVLILYTFFAVLMLGRMAAAGAPIPITAIILPFLGSVALFVAAPVLGRLAVIGLAADDGTAS